MKTAYMEQDALQAHLETENARLQKLVAELLARNEQLRQTLDSAMRVRPVGGNGR
jgi:hypothetical protein